jgi:H+/Cl- antiporter ClcA/predicted transcriptional regulator
MKASFLRMVWIAVLAMALGAVMTGVAQFLLWLIEVITGVSFFGKFEIASPVENHLGLAVILVPVIGGLVVGLMARYGSPAIRGHGIPEAMEQVLENASRIPARMTWLKPLSAAISIGTGGPFGAEGPIIATGGAGGSLLGQIVPTSSAERKTLLAAGAAAGMAATFGSPLSAVLLAVELLLFEFKPRSLIPVALSVCVASALRAVWIGSGPVFPMPLIAAPSLPAFGACLFVAALIGGVAFLVSRAVYFIEDAFEKLPVHWMWWPALGGLVVGGVGYLEPRTLGVGYSNITANLAGDGPALFILCLCVLKFVSWSVALGSGTSGGTLAPLLTIGSALGGLAGLVFQKWIPGLDPHLVALVGMACLFSGASQALLASAVFAYETTGQSAALFSLLACSAVAVMVVRALGRTSIMTEKIERRGVSVPSEFSADLFAHTSVESVMDRQPVFVNADQPLAELARKIASHDPALGAHQAHPVLDDLGKLVGIVTRGDVIRAIENASGDTIVLDCASTNLVTVRADDTLHEAIRKLLVHEIGRLLVVANDDPSHLVGYLGRGAILSARWKGIQEEFTEPPSWPRLSKSSAPRPAASSAAQNRS